MKRKQETKDQEIARLRKVLKQTSLFMKTRFEWQDINSWHHPFHKAVYRIDDALKVKKFGV